MVSDGTMERQLLGNAIEGLDIPSGPGELTPEFLTRVVEDMYPGTGVREIEFVKVSRYGEEMVSTSDRAVLRLTYDGTPVDLPRQVVVKMTREDNALAALYDTEVGFYRHFRNEVTIEAPQAVGAVFDPGSGRYCLLIEDLTLRGARFPTALSGVTIVQVDGVLDSLARLHAHFWDSPRFRDDLRNIQSHVHGRLFEHFHRRQTVIPEKSVADHSWKRELMDNLGRTPKQLWAEVLKAQAFQATLPQTIVHGDAHIGNTYLLPDDTGGLLDWQLTVRGAWVHDVNYIVITALSRQTARENEQELLNRYLERLKQYGVEKPPSYDEAWRAYRMAPAWAFEVGWLSVPDFSYGAELNKTCHERTAGAYVDLETSKLIGELM